MTPEGQDLTAEVDRLREENARLRAALEGDGPDEPGDSRRHRGSRTRSIASIVLLVLAVILAPLSVLTVWTRQQVLSTDRYLETVAPLATDPAVVSAVSERLTTEVTEALDVRSLAEEVLPERAAVLAGPIAAGTESLVRNAVDRVVRSDAFERAWLRANELAHEGFVAVATGREGTVVSARDGRVVVDLGALASEVLDQVDQQFGTELSSRVPLDRITAEFVLIDSQQLLGLQAAVRWLDRLAYATVVAALACLVGSVLLARDPRRALVRTALAFAGSMFVLLMAFAVGRGLFVANLPDGIQRADAAAAVYETLTRFVRSTARMLIVCGIVVAVIGWLAGPSRTAERVRALWNAAIGQGGELASGKVDLGPVPAWVARHAAVLRWLVVAAAALLLVLWDRPTGWTVVVVAAVALVPIAAIGVLAGAGRRQLGEAHTPA